MCYSLRFWPNNKSRMYLLENTGDFVKTNGLREGDFIVIYLDVKCGKYVRKRPLNKKELSRKEDDIVSVYENALTVHEPKLKVDLTAYVEKHEFCFDAVLDQHVTNDEVYRETVEPIIPIIFQRTKATCLLMDRQGHYLWRLCCLRKVSSLGRIGNLGSKEYRCDCSWLYTFAKGAACSSPA